MNYIKKNRKGCCKNMNKVQQPQMREKVYSLAYWNQPNQRIVKTAICMAIMVLLKVGVKLFLLPFPFLFRSTFHLTFFQSKRSTGRLL